MIWLIAFLAALLLAFVVVGSPVRIHFLYVRQSDDDNITVGIQALWGIVHVKKVVPMIHFSPAQGVVVKHKTEKKGMIGPAETDKHQIRMDYHRMMQVYHASKQLLANVSGFQDWLRHALAAVKVERLTWTTELGTGDAAETAFFYGLAWSIESNLLGFALKFMQALRPPEVTITPNYDKAVFATKLDCRTRMSVGQSMWIGLLLLVKILRVKGGLRTWRKILFPT